MEDAKEIALEDFLVSSEADFVFEAFQALQHQLAQVGERKRVLACAAASRKILPSAALMAAAD